MMYVKAGEIMSGSQTGEVSVLVTAEEHFGTNQTLVLLDKVKHSNYGCGDVCAGGGGCVKMASLCLAHEGKMHYQ